MKRILACCVSTKDIRYVVVDVVPGTFTCVGSDKIPYPDLPEPEQLASARRDWETVVKTRNPNVVAFKRASSRGPKGRSRCPSALRIGMEAIVMEVAATHHVPVDADEPQVLQKRLPFLLTSPTHVQLIQKGFTNTELLTSVPLRETAALALVAGQK